MGNTNENSPFCLKRVKHGREEQGMVGKEKEGKGGEGREGRLHHREDDGTEY